MSLHAKKVPNPRLDDIPCDENVDILVANVSKSDRPTELVEEAHSA